MIIQALIDIFLNPLLFLIDSLPTLELDLSFDIDSLLNVLSFANTIFPMSELMLLIILKFITVPTFSIVWNLILRVKSFIPTMGD